MVGANIDRTSPTITLPLDAAVILFIHLISHCLSEKQNYWYRKWNPNFKRNEPEFKQVGTHISM